MVTRRRRRTTPASTSAGRARPRRPRVMGASHQRFNELFEDASDIIIINDRKGRIVEANRAAREFGGYTAADVARGVHLPDVLPPMDCEAAMILTQRALDGLPVPEVYEREAILRDGRRRVLELRSNVLRRGGRALLLQTIARDVTDAREAAAFQNGLLQVSQALLSAQSFDELGQVICEEASRVLPVDGAYLWLRRGDELVATAAAGRGARGLIGRHFPIATSLVGEIYRALDVLVVNDFQHSLYNVEDAQPFNVQAMLAVPLRRTEPAAGLLVFTDTTNPRRFDATLRERALIFGAQTTVAIASRLAREREEEDARVSAALLRVTRAIRELLEERDVLREIARGAREAVQSDWATVGLRDETSGIVRVVATEGWPADAADELRLIEFSTETFPEFEPLFAHRTVEVPEPPREELYARWSVSSFLSVPMVRANRLIGSINVGFWQRRGPFSAQERRIAEGIGTQAAVAIDNAQLVQDLRRANQLKSEFLGTMSHELRTPLNAILGYTDLMREGAMGAIGIEQAEVLDRILLNGRALLELINMTLDVNRLEAGRVATAVSEFSLDELLRELRNEFALRTREGVALSWPERVDVLPLRTDHGKLKAVLRNLIDNALKFTPRGVVAVSVQDADSDGRVQIAVRDTGVGIPVAAVPSVFEMFRQLDATKSATRGGVGLGLYVVRRYTELLGGQVTVESVVGEGSTFTVDIPCRLAASAV